MKPTDIVAILRRRDLTALRQIPTALLDQTAVAGEAARLAWLDGLDYLGQHVTDWNRIRRGYRPLHAAIQEEPHDDPDRLRAIEWLLAHGADPEALAAWPPARALLVACFTGIPSYVEAIRPIARQDAFTAVALGQTAKIKTLLKRDPAFPNTRGDGGLTPLMIACATRLNPQASLAIATLLLDHGAALDTTTRSWDHDVDAIYFATHHTALFQLLLARGADPTHALVPALW